MRIGVATVQVPFIRGGAENHTTGLVKAISEFGHEAEAISMPFRFSPVSEVKRSMDIWESENFEHMNGYNMDLVICLKFPTFYLKHNHKIAWVMHQNRAVYDLWNTPLSEALSQTDEGRQLRQEIIERDNKALNSCKGIFANSKTVADRLLRFNQINSIPLYHPPKFISHFYNAPAEPYIFFPSRLEDLKRQDLLIKAMKYVKSPVVALLAGDGGKKPALQDMISQMDLTHRVRLIGRLTDDEMFGFYAHCLGVFFGPYDEDYGYVTLEAMLSAKSVITCTDSGGPLEFVIDKETGFVVKPEPEAVAQAIDDLYFHQKLAAEMGKNGRERYHKLNISWENVIQQLLRK